MNEDWVKPSPENAGSRIHLAPARWHGAKLKRKIIDNMLGMSVEILFAGGLILIGFVISLLSRG